MAKVWGIHILPNLSTNKRIGVMMYSLFAIEHDPVRKIADGWFVTSRALQQV
jgi:hypothetical protein